MLLLLNIFLTVSTPVHGGEPDPVEVQHDTLFSNYKKALTYYRSGQYAAALVELNKNLHDSLLDDHIPRLEKLLLGSYYLAANIFWQQTDYRKTIVLSNRFLKKGVMEADDRCFFLNKIGDAYYRLSILEPARNYTDQVLALVKDVTFEGSDHAALRAYQLVGLIDIEEGKYLAAKSNLKYCLHYLQSHNISAALQLQIFGNMAILFSKISQPDSSVYYYQQAMQVLESFKGGTLESRIPAIRAQINTHIGEVYGEMENYSKAYLYTQKAHDGFGSIYEETNQMVQLAQTNLANYLIHLKKFDEAIFYLEKSLRNNKDKYGGHTEIVLECYQFLGDAFFRKGLRKKSMLYYDSALQNNLKRDVLGGEVFSEMKIAVSTLDKRLKLARELKDDIVFATILKATHTELLSQMEYINAYLTDPVLDNMTRRLTLRIFECYDSLNETDSKGDHLEEMWALLELNKARKMDVQQKYLSSLFKLPIETQIRERELRDSLQLLVSHRRNRKLPYDSLYHVVQGHLNSLKDSIRLNHPRYFGLKYDDTGILSLREVQKVLGEGSILLSFFKQDTSIYTFSITKNTASFERETLSGPVTDPRSWKEGIMSKMDAGINSIIIAPHGSLWDVNFDLVPSPYNASKYLIQDLSIHYIYSATVHFGKPERVNNQTAEVLAFSYANETADSGGAIVMETLRGEPESLAQLPGSSLEISEISQIMEGNYYYGTQASELKFKQESKNYGIIHLAVHGEMSSQNPNDSRLIFFNSGDTLQDGSLYVSELYQMNLQANLAVLSACNTGSGAIKPGEGVQSLGRAFSFAGVPSLLLTRAEVSDVSTPYIMRFFYEGLRDGLRKSQALRQAKLKYLEDVASGSTADPSYWASFYILGDDSPAVVNQGFSGVFWYLLLLAIIALTVKIYFGQKRENI